MTKFFFTSLSAFLIVCSAHADEGRANIQKGDVTVGGGFTANYTPDFGLSGTLEPKAEYFVLDHFSVGGSMELGLSKFGSNLAVGPSATYYFWNSGPIATYVAQGVLFNRFFPQGGDDFAPPEIRRSIFGHSSLGVNYFITPSIAFGTSLNAAYPFSRDSGVPTIYSMQGAFSIYF